MIQLFRNARSMASAARTTFYGSLAATFAISDAEAVALVNAVVIAIVLADFGTWFLRSIFKLPSELLHGSYECLINVLFACLFFRVEPFDKDYDVDAIVIGFLVFLLVLAFKVAFYAVEFTRDSICDDLY